MGQLGGGPCYGGGAGQPAAGDGSGGLVSCVGRDGCGEGGAKFGLITGPILDLVGFVQADGAGGGGGGNLGNWDWNESMAGGFTWSQVSWSSFALREQCVESWWMKGESVGALSDV